MENLTNVQIVTWILTVLGGGMMGAVLKTVVDAYRDRVQPIAYRTDIGIIGGPSRSEAGLHAQVSILHNEEAYDLNNLSVITVEVVNRGNKDLESFTFGIEMHDGELCLFAEGRGEDHHHSITIQNRIPTPEARQKNVDFICQPFNRGNVYRIKLYLELPDGVDEASPIKLASPAPVRFTEAPSLIDALKEYATSSALVIGPIKITIPR
ncbi:MAG: hypothetical protein K9M08_17680 [Pirellula sp.]|nr:hypothetical protein [Pirellula sp.]